MISALAQALEERRHRFRTVCLWTLNDHTPRGMQYLVDTILAEGLPACYAENLAEIFGPTGVVDSTPDAHKKQGFEALRGAIEELSTQ